MIDNIVLLGSTGSIGTQTLDVCEKHNIRPLALSGNSNVKLLEQQARKFKPDTVCIADGTLYGDLKQRLADTDVTVTAGRDALCELAARECDTVVNAIVGFAGLYPTVAALTAGRTLALANKESLVAGGDLVTGLAREKGKIIPIDSEHSAIFQCLMGNEDNKIKKILLTVSGGPFYGYTYDRLKKVTVEDALRHPTWSMGRKITIDSATLMNKGLELIEAVRLFDVTPRQIEVVVHRQSILHSAVEYEDGSVIGQMGVADMRIPIQFALTYPKRYETPTKGLSLFEVGTLTFEQADDSVFLCLAAAKRAVAAGGTACAAINGANEAATGLFLEGKLPFYRIGELVRDTLDNVGYDSTTTLDTIEAADTAAREYVITHA
ncbi:MAG: 1-deoxy-D-xylulose-5-phosphate reductoisomerase [Eubacterium sp.]|nr:1-deoxy-D-xylulose-5-phosphate reductoisomerase [Eubacterium sp.]